MGDRTEQGRRGDGITGSLHKHTSGYGYGSWRQRPPDGFVSSTWVSPRTKNWVPDYGTATREDPENLERRAATSRACLVSGEIGEWMYGDKKSPSHAVVKVRKVRSPAQPVVNRAHRTPDWVQRPRLLIEDDPILEPIPDLERPPQTDLSLDDGRLDPSLARAHNRLDLALHQAPEAFKRHLPFGAHVNASAAVAQNELGASLTAHWTHSLRGQKW